MCDKSLITEKVDVVPEGREGVYMVQSDEIIKHLKASGVDQIHTFHGDWPTFIGFDWPLTKVIEFLEKCEGVAFVFPHQIRHALAGIQGMERVLFDLGEVDESLMNLVDDTPVPWET